MLSAQFIIVRVRVPAVALAKGDIGDWVTGRLHITRRVKGYVVLDDERICEQGRALIGVGRNYRVVPDIAPSELARLKGTTH
jgi:hypothetical protein